MGQTGGIRLKPVAVSELLGWSKDSVAQAIEPFLRSCRQLMDASEATWRDRPTAGGDRTDWQHICARAEELATIGVTDEAARAFFEQDFQAYLVSQGDADVGVFTGYFEIELTGSFKRISPDQVALYRLPPSDALRGQTRDQIAAGGLDGQGLELVWIDDPIAAFFLQVQGSGKVQIRDGVDRRVRYAGSNGLGYRSIGRKLIEDGVMDPEEVSMQSIIAWMQANPDQSDDLMNHNPSFVFFDWRESDAPIGAQGVGLTPGRSLAIDPDYIPYGAPIWLQTADPITGSALNRLVVAQDTGGAIKGAVRGDFYWGTGAVAGEYAGRMNQDGRYYLLLPKGLRLNLRSDGSFE